MATINGIWKTITNTILASPRQQPSAVTIPLENVDRGGQMQQEIEAGKDYFQVRINELFLRDERQWFNKIDPMVFVVSEFQYSGKPQIVPYVVGPGLMQQFGQKIPQGMLFRNEKVAGLAPYRGSKLTLSVVLCQMPVGSPARKFLSVIEGAAKAFDFASALGSYVTVGKVVLDGVEAMFGLDGTLPLIGLRSSFDPDAGDLFRASYFALIDAKDVDPKKLWVKDNQLFLGTDKDSAEPYRDNDFVLYSIVRTPDRNRNDVEQLSFYGLLENAVKEAGSLKDGSWENAKGLLISLLNAITLSPDLTREQGLQLINEYTGLVRTAHDQAKAASLLGPPKGPAQADELDDIRQIAASLR